MGKNTLINAFRILDLPPSASIQNIKKAYRNRAKTLHPDRNKAANAHKKFIELAEAYEVLIDFKTNKQKVYKPKVSYEDIAKRKRQQARENAQRYAKMKFEAYQKTDHYKNSEALYTILEHLSFIVSILLIASPLLLGLVIGLKGFVIGIGLTIIFSPLFLRHFSRKRNLSFKLFAASLSTIITSISFQFFTISIVNIYLFFRFSLNTEVTTLTFFLLFLFTIVFYLIVGKFKILKPTAKKYIFLGIIPTMFNLFFFTNYTFAYHLTTETYHFKYQKDPKSGINTNYIYLENNKYSSYHWFRSLLNNDKPTLSQNKITYTFAEGLFGLRVLKNTEITD